jgi:hypothetical protein
MFDDAWRTMKYRFYDPKLHGTNWDAMRLKYRPLVEYVGDRQELLNIVNEMIVELNASHTGAAPPPGGQTGNVSTGHLGLELEPDTKTGSYSLIDGSTVRTPGVGVFLTDKSRTNLENYGVQPDIKVDNTPEDTLAGRDRQLETAVEELLKQLRGSNLQANN